MTGTRLVVRAACAVTLLALATALPASAQTGPASAMDGRWHFTVAPYFWFAGLDGSVSVKGVAEVPVKVSFSDVWKNFDFGVLGRVEGRKDRWGLGAEVIYLNLGATLAADRPILGQLGLEADVRQLIGEGFGTYRVASRNDGYRYFDLNYDKQDAGQPQLYKVAYKGPNAFVAYSW